MALHILGIISTILRIRVSFSSSRYFACKRDKRMAPPNSGWRIIFQVSLRFTQTNIKQAHRVEILFMSVSDRPIYQNGH